MKKYSGLSDYQRAGTIFRDICNTIASSPHRSRFVSYEDLGDLKVAVREFRQTNDGAAQFRNYYSLCRIGMALKDAKDFGLIAPDFAEELASTIADVKSRCEGLQREVKERAAGSSGKDVTDLLKQKNTDIVKLRNDLSIILAGALMRSRPSDSQLAAVLDQIGLEDEGVPMRRSWLPCIGLVLGALTITSMIYLIGFAIFGEWLLGWPGRLMASSGSPLQRLVEFLGTLIGRDLPPQGGLPDVAGSILRNMAFALCSATVLYTLTAIVGYSVREHLLDDGEWRENAFTRVKSAFQVCVTTVPLSIVFNFLALSPNPGFFWIISNVTVSASISIVASIFFFRHIKSAASAPLKFERDGGARPRRFLGIGLRSWAVALCHGCIAFVMLFSLTYVNSMSALVLQNQNILDDLRNQIVELADKQATYEKDVSDKVVDLPAGYTRLIESYRKGQIENQLAGLEQGNFSSLAIFSGNGGERNFNKQIELLRSMCDFIVSGPVTDFSGPPKKANANSCYGGLAASLVIDEEPTEGWRNVLRSLATDLGFGEKFRPKLNGRLPTFAAAEKVSSTFATLDWNYEYLAKFYTLLKNFNYGGAVVAATSGAALAFMFSVIIVVGRRYEIDDFYSGLTRLGRVRLNRRMNEAGWNVDGRGPEEQFSQSLANPRSQLFEISIQEAMMSEGSYLRLQDQFWLASKNPDRSGDARGGPPKPEGAAQT